MGQLAAAVGDDRRQADQARAVLEADIGREPPDAAAVLEMLRRIATCGGDVVMSAMGAMKPGRRPGGRARRGHV